MDTKRRPFQGVLNILDFNRHFYVYGSLALLLLLVISYLVNFPSIVPTIIIVVFSYGLLMPLIVSAYVYDYSNYYSLDWLDSFIENTTHPYNFVNINAGFDETSFLIKEKYSNAKIQVYDFYDPASHTESAIVRARKISLVYPNTEPIKSDSIPHSDKSVDTIFLLSSAHEIRDFEEKVQFLKECRRICRPTGSVIMVEHLRDLPNFLAFTIGFTHFFSKKVWKEAFNRAGFNSIREQKFTHFMSIFECTP